MPNRRRVLTQLAAGAAAVPSVALGRTASEQDHRASAHHATKRDEKSDCARPVGPYGDYFPNVMVYAHDGRKALFYQDLLRGKTVLVNCMSIKNDEEYPVTANLVKVQNLLGERLGRDLFMYSLTVEPEKDTPRALRSFAERHGAKTGWLFLTAKPEDMELIRSRLFMYGGERQKHVGHAEKREEDCSLGLVRYGNESVGLWGAVPAKAEPEWIVKRLSWVETRDAPASLTTFKRRGPFPS